MRSKNGPNAGTDVHEFRYRRNSAWLGAIAAGGLLVAAIVGVIFGAEFSSNWGIFAAVFAILVLSATFFLFIFLACRAPVLLRVGPEGLDLPGGFTAPLTWHDIHRIRYLGESGYLTGKQAWLVVDPLPGVLPAYRFMGPKKAEAWLLGKIGIRIPLHSLETGPAVVISSIERFKSIRRRAS
ncbi:MAG: hypothetical protein ACR2O1_04345 [Boseongicola sp.]